MERVLHQPEGATAEGLQGFVERHGTEASVRHRERKVEQIEPSRIRRGRSGQSISAAAQQVLDRGADGFHP